MNAVTYMTYETSVLLPTELGDEGEEKIYFVRFDVHGSEQEHIDLFYSGLNDQSKCVCPYYL